MNQLIHFLLEHLIIDFEGEISPDTVTRLLRDDNSPLAKELRSRLLTERDVEDFLIVLADCLREHIPSGVNPDVIQDQISAYVEA